MNLVYIISAYRLPEQLVRLVTRLRTENAAPYGGSSYWCLSGDAVPVVHRYVGDHPEFVSFFRRVFIRDELFFQTILVNSELKNGIVNDDLRYMRWTATSAGPEVVGVDDFDRLRDTDSLFPRKFDQGVDGRVLDLIEEQSLV